ncbi:MAG: hypothetical protein SGI88_14125 [Candidatus Hydrogenedentes bacterium]|nr:hypothetical protein [Candidatus Hydrogenedentota bacterium]
MEVDAVDTNGKDYYDLKVTLAKMDGLWFPELVETKSMKRMRSPGSSFRLRIVKAELNGTIPDDEFTLDRLDFDRETAMMSLWRESSATTELMVYRDGAWAKREPGKLAPHSQPSH